jgi:osmotically-inducible protein OsmY
MTMHRLLLPMLLAISISSCAVMQGQQSAGEYIDDAAITAEIKSKMAADRQVAAGAISVETLDGTTQLSGFASSQSEKDRAASIAREAKGVKSVRNDIIVREPQQQR